MAKGSGFYNEQHDRYVADIAAPLIFTGGCSDGHNHYITEQYYLNIAQILNGNFRVTARIDLRPALPGLQYLTGIVTDGINLFVAYYDDNTVGMLSVKTKKVAAMNKAGKLLANMFNVNFGPNPSSIIRDLTTDGKNLYLNHNDGSGEKGVIIHIGNKQIRSAAIGGIIWSGIAYNGVGITAVTTSGKVYHLNNLFQQIDNGGAVAPHSFVQYAYYVPLTAEHITHGFDQENLHCNHNGILIVGHAN